MAELTETGIRERVRERYAGHAKLAIDVSPRAAREAEEACCGTTDQSGRWGDVLYDAESREGATESAVAASLAAAFRPRRRPARGRNRARPRLRRRR